MIASICTDDFPACLRPTLENYDPFVILDLSRFPKKQLYFKNFKQEKRNEMLERYFDDRVFVEVEDIVKGTIPSFEVLQSSQLTEEVIVLRVSVEYREILRLPYTFLEEVDEEETRDLMGKVISKILSKYVKSNNITNAEDLTNGYREYLYDTEIFCPDNLIKEMQSFNTLA